MALNTYAEAFFPERTDRAVLVLNALLGLGTALAPALVALVLALGAWWLLPAAVACMLAFISANAVTQPLRSAGGTDATAQTPMRWSALPRRLWLYAAAVLLYGMLETLSGNWAMPYLIQERGVSARGASFALTAFWAMVTVGRVLLALAGLACSAFLPLSISFGGNEFPRLAAVIAGELIAFYQLGYGLAAFGAGPLRDLIGLPFSTIFAASSIVALPLAVIAALIMRQPLVARQPPPMKT